MLRALFFGTATLVVLIHLLRDSLGLVHWNLGVPIMVGIWGVFIIPMIDETASVLAAMRFAEKVEQAAPTEEQKQKMTEAIMHSAIEGGAPTPRAIERALAWPMVVSLGLLAGAALAWVGQRLLSLLPGG